MEGMRLKVVSTSTEEESVKQTAADKNWRAEAARRSFVSQKQRTLSMSGGVSAPARFRVASGRADAGDRTYATDENRLAGWLLVEKKKANRKLWRRRFLEVDDGIMRIYKTGIPQHLDIDAIADFSVRVEFLSEGAAVELFSGTQRLLRLSSGRVSKMRGIAERILARRFGDDIDGRGFMTTVENEKQEQVLLSWDGSLLAVFEKRQKAVVELTGLSIETSDFPDLGSGERQHKLHISNLAGSSVVLTVPDSLLLLQWCGAISGADSAPLPKKSSTHSVFQQVLVNDLASNPDSRPRTMSLGLSELGSDDIAMPSREQIKKQMIDSEEPLGELKAASLARLLQNPTVRRWLYLWSRVQHCSESVKFIAAVERIKSLPGVKEKAQGLRVICADFIDSEGISSLNIGGKSRKHILGEVAKCANDEEVAALLPVVLEKALEEIMRVLEYDLAPQFKQLLEEAWSVREGIVSPPMSPHDSPGRESGPALDYSKLRYVSELVGNEDAMKEFLLFCTDKQDQDAALFITLVQEFKRAPENARRNMSVNIARTFFGESSPHALPLNEAKLRLTERGMVEKMLCPPTGLFDHQHGECMALLEGSGVFRRFCKSKKEKKKKGLFSTLGKSSRSRSSSSSNILPLKSPLHNRPSSSVIPAAALAASLAKQSEDDRLEY